MEATATERSCCYEVRRGGNRDGSYDRMNRSRYEQCGRPLDDSPWYCKRHRALVAKQQARHDFLKGAR